MQTHGLPEVESKINELDETPEISEIKQLVDEIVENMRLDLQAIGQSRETMARDTGILID
jgi:hypothetical protein